MWLHPVSFWAVCACHKKCWEKTTVTSWIWRALPPVSSSAAPKARMPCLGMEAGCKDLQQSYFWVSSLRGSFCLSLPAQKSSSMCFSTLSSHHEIWWFHNLFSPTATSHETKILRRKGGLGSQVADQSRHQRIMFQLPSLPHSDPDLAPQQLPVWRRVPSPLQLFCSRYRPFLIMFLTRLRLHLPAYRHLQQGTHNLASGMVWTTAQQLRSCPCRHLAIHKSSIQPQFPPGSPWSI